MKELIYSLESTMWEFARNRDVQGFAKLVAPDAVMVCGGYRCSGAEYTGFVADFGISSFEIIGFELVYESECLAQSHYIVRTVAEKPEYEDLAGLFHVTTTWHKRGEQWVAVFNMDSRIVERQE